MAYSGAGVPLWTNRYIGAVGPNDRATAVAVDASGNVFVTGTSVTGSSSFDFATVAYSGSGVLLWDRRYNGPGNGEDSACSLAVDGSGNVIVTGTSIGTNALAYPSAFATVAYSGEGVPLWTNRYKAPGPGPDYAYAVAVDGSGNVFVTGNSIANENFSDYTTVAYSHTGAPLWTNCYNGPANSVDSANAVAVDGSGNVFVTGRSLGDYTTLAYSGEGVPLWTNRYNGPGKEDDVASAMAVARNGNVIVTGSSAGNGSYYDYATVAYSGAGVALWTNRYNGPDSLTDEANAVAVDGSGNVFVTGYSTVSAAAHDYVTVAYSGAGLPLWTNRYNGPGNSDDVAYAVAADGGGKVFVTGRSGSMSTADFATVAYSSAGVPLWTNRYNGTGNSYDQANAMAVDRSGNVFVTGESLGTDGTMDYATVAYSGAGVPLWTNRYNGPAKRLDWATAIAVDGVGNVFVTGGATVSGTTLDYVTVAYSGAGVPLWTNGYNGPVNRSDIARAVAVDGSGNVLVTGQSIGNGGTNDFATVAYSGAGAPLWTNRYNGPANGDDLAPTKSCIAISPDGAVYVTGASDGDFTSGATYDFVTIKYTPTLMPIGINSQIVGDQLMLSWTNAAFSLESAPTVQGIYSTIPGATSPYITPFSGTQRYFRLKAN